MGGGRREGGVEGRDADGATTICVQRIKTDLNGSTTDPQRQAERKHRLTVSDQIALALDRCPHVRQHQVGVNTEVALHQHRAQLGRHHGAPGL